MTRVIVGITGNEREIPSKSGISYLIAPKDLAEGVLRAGGLPFIFPVARPKDAKSYVDQIDKLILAGGQHVLPHFYGEKQEIDSEDYWLARDEFELALIKEALKQKKPILGICRGMQLLNVALGGSLEQEVEGHWQESWQGVSQQIKTQTGSRLQEIFSPKTSINSFHQQRIKSLANELTATAFDPNDGTIEAYEGKNLPLLGIQWHPEFLLADQKHQALFEYLVEKL